MTKIDQFESSFKAAERVLFDPEPVRIAKVLLITDRSPQAGDEYQRAAQTFLSGVLAPEVEWDVVGDEALASVGEMLHCVERHEAQLICTYRNLRIPAREYPYSLGVYLDVLTQSTATPVLVLPHPDLVAKSPELLADTSAVMAVTDHLTGDHRLVSYGAFFTQPGKLFLTHVEDQRTFDRYIDIIGKIPAIDTETARESILSQLLKEPEHFVESCRAVLEQAKVPIQVESLVLLGRHLADYQRMIQEHAVKLMVLNTKDEEQLAMHGIAYPLIIELRKTPMLLL